MKREISTLFRTMATSYGFNIAGIIPSVFTVYFFTRVFTPEIAGQLALITTAATFVQSIAFNWLASALVRFGRDEYIRTGSVRQIFRVRAILLPLIWFSTLLVFVGLYLFAHGFLTLRLGLSGRIVWAVPLFLTLWVVFAELQGYMNVFGKYVQIAAASFLGQLFQVIALLFLFWYLQMAGIDWLITISIGSSVLQSLFLLVWLKRGNFKSDSDSSDLRENIQRTLRYSAPAIGTPILGYLYNPIQYFLIFYFVSVAAVGVYNIANNMNAILVQFVMLFPSLMFPVQQGLKAEGKHAAIHNYYHRIVPQLTILFAIAVSFGIVGLPPVIRLVLSVKYQAAVPAFLILAYGEILQMTTALESIYSSVYDKLIQGFWVAALQCVIQVACYVLLIPRIGIEGVAVGWVVAYLGSTILVTHFVSQQFGVPKRTYVAVALSAALGLGALLLSFSGAGILLQLAGLLVMIFPLLLAIKMTKLFHYDDLKFLMATGIPRILQVVLRWIYQTLS